MKILLVTDTLSTGGAETFVLRLGAALHARRHEVFFFVLRDELTNHALRKSIAPDVPILSFRVPLLKAVLRLDGLLFRVGLKFSLLRWLQVRRLTSCIQTRGAQVVHSHLLTADLVTARACTATGAPWVTTMHGDYLGYESRGRIRVARIQSFHDAMLEIERSVRHMVVITGQQSDQLYRLMPRAAAGGQISKIYNGYASPADQLLSNRLAGALSPIPSNGFVIGMVARGIRDKGWDVMLAAFQELDIPDAWLVLVGDGDYLQVLKKRVFHPRVIFTGNVANPLSYVARFDVGCLPSRYRAESLPTVIIEYLVLGKPVIATDLGDIAQMINAHEEQPAGLLLKLDSVEGMAREMKAALEHLYRDQADRARLQANTRPAAQRFDMDLCVDKYLAVYREAQQS